MTTMEQFLGSLKERVPGAKLSLDRPEHGGGSWWLDARLGKSVLVVEWKSSMGFGVSSLPSEGYGEGPDEFYADEDEALARVEHLLRSGERTRVPEQLALKELRETMSVSQEEMAKAMKVAQGTVSKIERRSNPSLTVLRDWVEALGGDLEIAARFKERTVKIVGSDLHGRHEASFTPERPARMSDKKLFVERRPEGDYAIRRPDADRASAVEPTQKRAIERAKKIQPGAAVHVERQRHTSKGKPDKWRKP